MSANVEDLDWLLKYAEKRGFDYIEARHHALKIQDFNILNGLTTSVNQSESAGFSLRVVKDNIIYFFSSPSKEKIKEDLEYFHPLSARPWSNSFGKDEDIFVGEYKVTQKTPLDLVSLGEKIKFMKNVMKDVEGIKISSKILSFELIYIELFEKKDIITSDGASVHSEIPRVWNMYSIVMREGDRSINAFSDELGSTGGYEVLNSWNLQEYLSEKVKSFNEVIAKAKATPSSISDIVLSGQIAGIIAHESAGHPFEADRVLGREGAQAGMSYLTGRDIKSDRHFASESVSVVDDPTLPYSMGFFLSDDEGVRARRKFLIKDGMISELLYDRSTSSSFGVKSNGSVRTSDFTAEPIIRMSNTFFLPSSITFDEMIEDIREGVFIKSFMEWNIDDLRWSQRYVGLEAYEIKQGELGSPVLFPVFEANTGQIYNSIVAVDNNLSFYAGMCGKGEPSQVVPVWMGGPDLRLRGLSLKKLGD
jgi:TldD protein